MHYRELNTVTKFDKFLLLRIDNLLGQLGSTKFFTTLDLASGFWQVKVHSDSRTKTAYVTPQWLYALRMMYKLVLLVKIPLMMMLMIYQLYCARDNVSLKLLALKEDNHLTELMIYLKT